MKCVLTAFFLIQVFFTWFGVLYHNFFLDKALRCAGFRGGIGVMVLLLLLQLLWFRDCVTYCWFDAVRCDWRFFIVTRCTSSWIAYVEKWFIMSRRRDSLTIKIKPTKTNQILDLLQSLYEFLLKISSFCFFSWNEEKSAFGHFFEFWLIIWNITFTHVTYNNH